MMDNESKQAKEKKTLAVGSFAAKTVAIFWADFAGDGSRHVLGIEVEFTEGPNIGLHGTAFASADSLEFFHNALIACGWVEGMAPTKVPLGRAVKAVVETDTNPKSGVKKNIVKYINSIEGRKSALAEKYGLTQQNSDAWDKQFLMASANFIKTTGFNVPKSGGGQKPAQQQQQIQTQQQDDFGGGGSADDDEIPF